MKGREKKIVEKEKEFADLRNQLARCLADYDNLRKRVDAEKEMWIDLASERILTKFIGVLDMFESAQEHLKDQGLAIALSEFKKAVEDEGVIEIRPVQNDAFDPNIHEAVDTVEGGKKGQIAELVLTGWRYKEGKILRAAKVKVFGDRINK